MTLKDWSKAKKFKNEIIWDRNGGGWVYLYSRGMFRGLEDSFVISTSLIGGSNPDDRRNIPFKSKPEALAFAKKYMRSH